MAGTEVAPYGTWRSPLTSDLIVADTIRLSDLTLDGEAIYWVESRPAEGGRSVVVRRAPDGTTSDVTPPPFNARTRVHEYGGRAYLVAGGSVVCSNFADGRLYRVVPGESPQALTPAGEMRYADGAFDAHRNRIILVREDHTASAREAVNTLVSLALDGNDAGNDAGAVLVDGNGFYAAPRLSPDGSRLAWLSWNHPNMPWDETELWVGAVAADGSLGHRERVAGGSGESIVQPEWSPDGILHYVSDRTGWWNLYRRRDGRDEPLHSMEAEFALPSWVFGRPTYDFAAADDLICAYTQRGRWSLARLDAATGRLAEIAMPYSEIHDVRVAAGQAVFLGGGPTRSWEVARLDLGSGETSVLRRSSAVAVDPAYLSTPQEIAYPTEGGLSAHAFFYPPQNKDYTAPPDERPPLLVMSHGGPTAAASSALDLEIQYWTSRGIAVLDVNYGGSTGYGRPYRQRLDGAWGVVDVDDCVNGARYLAAQGRVDGARLIIRGGSAGGYTTLAALTFRDVFKAGASYYGVGDLEALAQETHKFESRYLDRLIGPYPARQDLYRARSPIHFTERLSAPAIFFQGLDDKVVPPDQAETMVAALRAKGLPVAYLAFEGEGHGFRSAATIKRALDAELYFYARVFGFQPADALEPVAIENL